MTHTVLLVDDDQDFSTLVTLMLAQDDIRLVKAATGQGGLDAIREHRPAVVILDLMLPDMNGWEVFLKLRQTPEGENIPVIILSAVGTRYDRTFGLRVARVHDYLTKPCLPSQLRQSVAAALRQQDPAG